MTASPATNWSLFKQHLAFRWNKRCRNRS